MLIYARKIGMSLLCLLSAHVWADSADSDYTIHRSPTMAAFYNVAADGRAVREVDDTAVIADPHAKPSTVIVTGRPKATQRVQPEKVPRIGLAVSVAPKQHDSLAEFRCERFGFYYTSRGECIVPAAKYIYVVSADKPGAMLNKDLAALQPYKAVIFGRR